jgi:integrase
MQLSQQVVNSSSYPYGQSDKPFYLMDSELCGYGLRLYASGRKVFILRYRTRDGRRRFYQMGDAAKLTEKKARAKAKDLLAEVQLGADPAEEKEVAREAFTVSQLCDEFIERYAKAHRKSWAEDERRLNKYIKPAWGPRKASAITRGDAAKLHIGLAERGHREANQVINLVRRIWALGAEWGLVDGPNPGLGVKRFKERSRERWLSAEELRRLIESIDAEVNSTPKTGSLCEKIVDYLAERGPSSNAEVAVAIDHPLQKTSILLASLVKQERVVRPEPGLYAVDPAGQRWFDLRAAYIRAALWLYILTGCRKSELLGARWDDVNWGRAELVLPVTKSGDTARVPLSEPALAILRALPREAGNPFIFPSPRSRDGKPKHMANIQKRWEKIRTRAGLEDVRLHDLRRTVGSWLASSGNSVLVVQQALHHKSYQAALIYARLSADPVRGAMEDHGRAVLEALKPSKDGAETEAANVTSLRGR